MGPGRLIIFQRTRGSLQLVSSELPVFRLYSFLLSEDEKYDTFSRRDD